MSRYIDLDSSYRDRVTYQNPADYVVESSQANTWYQAPRTVNAFANPPQARALDFTQSIEVKHLLLPYTDITYRTNTGAIVTTHTANLQRVYLNIHSVSKDDRYLISTIENKISKAKFVCTRKEIQSDANDVESWILFECKMDQVMRFNRGEGVVFQILQEQGYVIVISDPCSVRIINSTNLGPVTDSTPGTSGFNVVKVQDGNVVIPEITDVTPTADSGGSLGGVYFTINNGSDAPFYVWYNVDGGSVDPAPGGTGIVVNININDSALNVAEKTQLAILANDNFTAELCPTVDPTKQTNCLIEITPFYKDGAYDNHAMGLIYH